MIVLNRENIIEGLIELRNQEESQNNIIVENIKDILSNSTLDNLEKLKLINNELGKVIYSY